MESLTLVSHSPEETHRLGTFLGRLASAGDVFLLIGNLGAGKTCLTQGIAWGLEVEEYAFSPSFVILREYSGRLTLYHIDFYRLDHLEEIVDLGLDEYLYGNDVCVVEWAEKGLKILPQENLLITIDYISNTERALRLEAKGKRYSELLKKLALNLKEAKEQNND